MLKSLTLEHWLRTSNAAACGEKLSLSSAIEDSIVLSISDPQFRKAMLDTTRLVVFKNAIPRDKWLEIWWSSQTTSASLNLSELVMETSIKWSNTQKPRPDNQWMMFALRTRLVPGVSSFWPALEQRRNSRDPSPCPLKTGMMLSWPWLIQTVQKMKNNTSSISPVLPLCNCPEMQVCCKWHSASFYNAQLTSCIFYTSKQWHQHEFGQKGWQL